MSTLAFGDRIGKTARLAVGCAGFVFTPDHTHLLLTQRRDNGRWCLPGGHLEPGESVTEAAIREVREETGLRTVAVRLLGVWSDPDQVFVYSDGNRWQSLEVDVELVAVGGAIIKTDEVEQSVFISLEGLDHIDLMESEAIRVVRALRGETPYVW